MTFNDNGSLFESFFKPLSFIAMSKFPIPSLLKRMFKTPFLEEIPSIFIISVLSLNNSFTDIFKFNSPIDTNVSPKNGALLIINNLSKVRVAFGKLLNKLKLASANETLASTFSLIAASILAFI